MGNLSDSFSFDKCPECGSEIKFTTTYSIPSTNTVWCISCGWKTSFLGKETIKIISGPDALLKRPSMYSVNKVIEFVQETHLNPILKEGIVCRLVEDADERATEAFEEMDDSSPALICDLDSCLMYLENIGFDFKAAEESEDEEEDVKEIEREFGRVDFPFNVMTEDYVVLYKTGEKHKMKVYDQIAEIVEENDIDMDVLREVLDMLIDMMEYNGDDTYYDIIENAEQNKAFQFLKRLTRK